MIGVGAKVCWRGTHGSRVGRVVSFASAPDGRCVVVADDSGLPVTVRIADCTVMHDETVTAPTDAARCS